MSARLELLMMVAFKWDVTEFVSFFGLERSDAIGNPDDWSALDRNKAHLGNRVRLWIKPTTTQDRNLMKRHDSRGTLWNRNWSLVEHRNGKEHHGSGLRS